MLFIEKVVQYLISEKKYQFTPSYLMATIFYSSNFSSPSTSRYKSKMWLFSYISITTTNRNLLSCPCVQIHRLHFGDVYTKVAMDASTAYAHEHAKVPGCPSWTLGKRQYYYYRRYQCSKQSRSFRLSRSSKSLSYKVPKR